MIRTIPFVVALFISFAGFAQDAAPEWFVLRFGEETANAIAQDAPEKLAMYVFMDANGHSIQDVSPKDISAYPDALAASPRVQEAPALSLELMLSDGFHPELYNFQRKANETVWYRIGDSNYLMTVHSNAWIQEKMNSEE